MNLRYESNILKALVNSLQDRKNVKFRENFSEVASRLFIEVAKGVATTKLKNIKLDNFGKVLDLAMTKPVPEGLSFLIKLLVEALGNVTLIIDEANIAFTLLDEAEEARTAKKALELFTTLTKEENKVCLF